MATYLVLGMTFYLVSFTGQYLAKEPQDCRFIFYHLDSVYSSIAVFDFIVPVLIICNDRVIPHKYYCPIAPEDRAASYIPSIKGFDILLVKLLFNIGGGLMSCW